MKEALAVWLAKECVFLSEWLPLAGLWFVGTCAGVPALALGNRLACGCPFHDAMTRRVDAQWGQTTLLYAAAGGHKDTAALLLNRGASVDCADQVRAH